MNNKIDIPMIVPERIQLETVFACNARCTMCPVHDPSDRKHGIMTFETFKSVIDQLDVYKEKISKVDLWGLGEPLMDKNLPEKIRYAKQKGFQGLAIATNAELLTEEKAIQLFEAGLDTIIFSIDGVHKETHEGIRIGLTFEVVIENAGQAIRLRNNGDYDTKFVFRFIRQNVNRSEWEQFREYWGERISLDRGDIIIGYDVHTWGGEIENLGQPTNMPVIPDEVVCHHLFDRLMILYDGTVPMCCSDMHHAKHSFGNVQDASPIEVFNSKRANGFRSLHEAGKRNQMKICEECTILESEEAEEVEAWAN